MPDNMLFVVAVLITLGIVVPYHYFVIGRDPVYGKRFVWSGLPSSLLFIGLPMFCFTVFGFAGLRGDYGESARKLVMAGLVGIGIFTFGYWCGASKSSQDSERRQKEEHDRIWYERNVRGQEGNETAQADDPRRSP